MKPTEHRIDAKFDIAHPYWTVHERWQQTWHFWLTPVVGTLFIGLPMIFGASASKFTIGAWLAAYLFHTWLLTNSVLWHWKFTDCVSHAWHDAFAKLSREVFEAGRLAGREEAKREEKPWL